MAKNVLNLTGFQVLKPYKKQKKNYRINKIYRTLYNIKTETSVRHEEQLKKEKFRSQVENN